MMMIVMLIAGLGAGGGGAWFAAKKFAAPAAAAASAEKPAADEHGEAPADEHGGGGDEHGGGGDDHGGGGGAVDVTYVPLAPAFVVNLEDMDVVRYLQLEIEVTVRRPVVVDEIKLHMPAIRNALLMLFSDQDYHNLLKVEGKEKLRQDALAEVRRVMKEQSGAGGIDNLYFTSFVSQ
jgi:flagellar FliL protein